MEISQASQSLFVMRIVDGKKVKMAPEALTKFEREDAKKYYNQKILRKSQEQVKLLKTHKEQLEEVTRLYVEFSEAKEKYYAIENQIKQGNESIVTLKRVVTALLKQDTIEEGLSFVLDEVEKAQTSDEGTDPDQFLSDLRSGEQAL